VADIIIALLPLVKVSLAENGTFITSGIITERLDDVTSALESAGFVVDKVTHKDNWVSVVASYPGLEGA